MTTQSHHTQNTFSTKLNRNVLNMPKWVTEANDRIGPKPPPPPTTASSSQMHGNAIKLPAIPPKFNNQPEPDYEVIEFSGQQYSNEPMMMMKTSAAAMRPKTPDTKLKCTLCGSNNPWVKCEECASQIFCASCDDMYHKHPKRKTHMRKALEQNRPPVPPKTLPGQSPVPPVAPPRRGKRGIPTPVLQRKDQIMNTQNLHLPPPSPTPSMKSSSWNDRVDTLKRGLGLMNNRPLPDTPKTPTPSDGANSSSRSNTPKSAFDGIQRPPSVTLEKIKHKASATLDRMAILQQRYRQQKEAQERNRSGSIIDQNLTFDQWSHISQSPSHFRSGSMSSGLNSSQFDLTDDSHFNLFHQRQMQQQQQQQQQNKDPKTFGNRGMSTSVFNLNQINPQAAHQPTKNPWMNANHQMQQAQSMAQLNCANCNGTGQQSNWNPHYPPQQQMHAHPDDWCNQLGSQQHLNRSNLSLNVGAGYMMPHHHHPTSGIYPPPVFMTQRNMMYPYAYPAGMPVMNPGLIAMPPPPRSRATSRAGSRGPSPTMSRKSMPVRRKITNYHDDEATDDEDSDIDEQRSMISNRSGMTNASHRQRQRRMSSASQLLADDDSEAIHHARNVRSKAREQRRGSMAKSVQSDWIPGRRASTNNVRPKEAIPFGSPLKPAKVYSDLDSESSGTRALVQAKIQQKLDEGARKQGKHQTKSSESETEKPLKKSTEVQTPGVRSVKSTIEPQSKPNETRPEESDEYEEEEVEEEEEKSGAEEENGENIDDEESPPMGPPPSAPDYEWECEFCTFVNEPNVKICTICCKTPSKQPARPTVKPIQPPATLQQKQPQSQQQQPKLNTATKAASDSDTSQVPKKKLITNSSSTTSIMTNGLGKSKMTSSENESDNYAMSKKKESLEDIWATLDENIQATADEVKRKAETKKTINKKRVSTACGTSPIKEIPQASSSKVQKEKVEESTTRGVAAKEIGTSPPPQSISTQTYDVLPLRESELENNLKIDSRVNNIQPFKPTDPSPFEHQTLSHPDHNFHYYRDTTSALHDRERDRYRSSNDLRYGDTSSSSTMDFIPGLGRRQSSISELLAYQRAHSQMHSPLHGGGGGYSRESLQYDYHQKPIARDPETELYILLKEAELYKFSPEELHAALKYCGSDVHPIQWLRENWPKLVQTVQSLATKYGQERSENIIGTISQIEARDALRTHAGNIWQAVSECIEQRQRKFREISNKGNYSHEDIVTALTAHQGNIELALIDLSKTQLKPFLMRIWGSPGGVENESGPISFETSPASSIITSSGHRISSEIHEFLSANASECLQIPSAAGAFILQDHLAQLHETSTNDNSPNSHTPIENRDLPSPSNTFSMEDSLLPNKNMLKDLETLIGNMEENQAKQNQQVLRSIEGMLETFMSKREIENDIDPEAMRILMKSPITTKAKSMSREREKRANSGAGSETSTSNATDVKNFMWQHIQEIVPNLVQQVEMDLMENNEDGGDAYPDANDNKIPAKEEKVKQSNEPPPVNPEEFIMEEVIKPNMKEAHIRELAPPEFAYTAEIANFQMEFDRGLERQQEIEYNPLTLDDAERIKFSMSLAPNNIEPKVPEIHIEQISENLLTASSTTEVPRRAINTTNQSDNQTEKRISIAESEDTDSLSDATTVILATDISSEQRLDSIIGAQETTGTYASREETTSKDTSKKVENRKDKHQNEATSRQATQKKEAISEAQRPVNESQTNQTPHFIDSSPTELPKPQTDINQDKIRNSKQHPKKSQLPRNINKGKHKSNAENKIPEQPQKREREENQKGEELTADANTNTNETTKTPEDQSEANGPMPIAMEAPNTKSLNAGPSDVTSTSNKNERKNTSRIPVRKTSILNEIKIQKTEIGTEPGIEDSSHKEEAKHDQVIISEQLQANSTNLNDEQEEVIETNIAAEKHSTQVDIEITPTTPKVDDTSEASPNDETPEIFQDLDEISSDEEEKLNEVNENQQESQSRDPIQHKSDESDTSDEELYSINSGSSITENFSQRDMLQSPTSESEMLLVFQSGQQVQTTNGPNPLEPSLSTATITSIMSQASKVTASKEFIPSSDPSKQNLSELVEDTQRLIKQMKDEISLDDFESSDDEYTEDYSDEFDEDEGEDEEEGGGDDGEEWGSESGEAENTDIDDDEEDDDAEEETDDGLANNDEQIETTNTDMEVEEKKIEENEKKLTAEEDEENESSDTETYVAEVKVIEKVNQNDKSEEIAAIDTHRENRSSSIENTTNNTHTTTDHQTLSSSPSSSTYSNIDNTTLVNHDHINNKSLTENNKNVTKTFTKEIPSNIEATLNNTNYQQVNENEEIQTTVKREQSEDHQYPPSFQVSERSKSPITKTQIINVENAAEILPDKAASIKASENQANLQSAISDENIESIKVIESLNNLAELLKHQADEHQRSASPVAKTSEPETQVVNQPTVSTSGSNASENLDTERPKSSGSVTKRNELAPQTNDQPKEIPSGFKTVENLFNDHQRSKSPTTKKSEVVTQSLNSKDEKATSSKSQEHQALSADKSNPAATTSQNLPKLKAAKEESSKETTKQPKSPITTKNLTDSTDQPSASSKSSINVSKTSKPTSKSAPTKTESSNEPSEQPAASSSISNTTKEPTNTNAKRPAASKIPKPNETTKASSKKAPVRSKSFSVPPTHPIGISSVKAIQQQFLNRQSQVSAKTNPPPKNAPTVVRKKSISEAISKFTKSTEANSNSVDGPSTGQLFRSRTQPRIPKKKYHETCFSDDDYETTTSEDEDEPLEVRQRKLSIPVFRAYASVQEPEPVNPEDLARKFVDENLVATISEAQIAAALVNMKFQQDVSIWAAKECSDLDQAISLLQQECELCMGTFALNEIVSMLKCTHKCCKHCAKKYFTVQITDRSINDCNCPYCKIPELHNQSQNEDEHLEYFSNLDIFLKNIVDPEVHELFQRKLRDRTLLQDPNFKWCIQCASGFFARPKQKRLICPDCGSVTCSQCRKPWEKQHEGITCAQYWEWKQANDPDLQVQGVNEHLAQNGIDCPKCKFKYSLTRGGCMHFTCTQCKFEFCYGCDRPFMMGAKCTISPYCAKLGLHAHHPRNCLFYLRDKIPLQLQFLLKENGVAFDVDPIENTSKHCVDNNANDDDKPGTSAQAKLTKVPARCPIALQKETPSGLVDTICNGDVPDQHAGMCRTHYVEYLTAKVAKARIDPLPIFDLTDCVQELRRRGIPLPERGPWDTDEIYKNMCIEVIKQNIPLYAD